MPPLTHRADSKQSAPFVMEIDLPIEADSDIQNLLYGIIPRGSLDTDAL